MSDKEFIEMYMCVWEPDPKHVELENKLIEYYKVSEHLDHKTIHKLWRELRLWADCSGISYSEFNRAKRRVSGMNLCRN